jgi:hypothetical protein
MLSRDYPKSQMVGQVATALHVSKTEAGTQVLDNGLLAADEDPDNRQAKVQ